MNKNYCYCIGVFNLGKKLNKVICQIAWREEFGERTLENSSKARFESEAVDEWNMTPERRLELLLVASPNISVELHSEIKEKAYETCDFLVFMKNMDIIYCNNNKPSDIMVCGDSEFRCPGFSEYQVVKKEIV